MKRLEKLMGWCWETSGWFNGTPWIDHLGQYRKEATIDDVLSYFEHEGFVMSGCHYSPAVKKYVVTMLGAKGDVVAAGETLYGAFVNAVSSYVELQ